MLDFTFRTADGPILVQLCAPEAKPKCNLPFSVEVRLNGRPSIIPGEDPLEALWMAARFASSYVSGSEGLDPPVHELPLTQVPDLLVQGFREGLLAVLDARGISCPDTARARIAACSDPTMLQQFLARAKTAASMDETFDTAPIPPVSEGCKIPGDMIELTFRTDDGPILIQLCAPVATPGAKSAWAAEARTNGQPQTMVGEDPLEALEFAARYASSYLSGRGGLEPSVNDLPLFEGLDLLVQGYCEGVLAVLDVRGIPCPDEARARIAACADPVVLQRLLACAKTAATVDEVLAALPPPVTP